jgi:hypothetical protein
MWSLDVETGSCWLLLLRDSRRLRGRSAVGGVGVCANIDIRTWDVGRVAEVEPRVCCVATAGRMSSRYRTRSQCVLIVVW